MRISVATAWLAVLVCGLACGGQVEPGGDGGPSGSTSGGGSATTGSSGSANSSGSAGSSGGSGSSSGETVPPCPANAPVPGSKCEGPGQQGCAYFEPDGTCQAFVCNSSGVWVTSSEGC